MIRGDGFTQRGRSCDHRVGKQFGNFHDDIEGNCTVRVCNGETGAVRSLRHRTRVGGHGLRLALRGVAATRLAHTKDRARQGYHGQDFRDPGERHRSLSIAVIDDSLAGNIHRKRTDRASSHASRSLSTVPRRRENVSVNARRIFGCVVSLSSFGEMRLLDSCQLPDIVNPLWWRITVLGLSGRTPRLVVLFLENVAGGGDN